MKFLLITLVGMLGFNTPSTLETKTIDVTNSTVVWTGKKVTGSHTGGISIAEGKLEFDGGMLKSGTIVMDMTSLTCTDMQGGGAAKLVGHLNSGDFFGTEEFPTASLAISGVTAGTDGASTITGNLSIKGVAHPISFDANIGKLGASATIAVDRTKYGIKYGSGSFFDNLGDKAISDTFELVINLVY